MSVFFKDNTTLGVPQFKLQGSYKFKTTVLDWYADHDIDLGMYFKTIPAIKSSTLMQHVYEVCRDLTWYGAEHKKKCVQVFFRNEYSIDLPIYCFDRKKRHWMLATKTGWEETNPEGFSNWIAGKRDRKGQLLRIVKYFKMWASEQNFKTPKGIALTVWIAKYYVPETREDIAFVLTLKKLKSAVKKKMICKMPVAPYDDLIEDLTNGQRSKFMVALERLIQTGEQAVKNYNLLQCAQLWRNELGAYFPKRIKV